MVDDADLLICIGYTRNAAKEKHCYYVVPWA